MSHWTLEEKIKLAQMIKEGKRPNVIARELNRSVSTVRSKIYTLDENIDALSQMDERLCLKGKQTFLSSGLGNRICPCCSTINSRDALGLDYRVSV